MLEPTGRVLAKTILRGWIEAEYEAETSAEEFAVKFTTAMLPLVVKNKDLLASLMETFVEVIEEVAAETAETAVPNVNPYPLDALQPVAAPCWNDDAGSGC